MATPTESKDRSAAPVRNAAPANPSRDLLMRWFDPQTLRRWVMPIAFLFTLTVGGYLLLRLVDSIASGAPFFSAVFPNDADGIEGAVGNFAQVMVGILGLVITVVAIVVQLAAQRYTPKLVDLFLKDKVNIGYFLLMVTTNIYTMILAYSAMEPLLLYYSGIFMLALLVLNLVLLVPYFNYVFLFLTPGNIISIIRKNAKGAMERVTAQAKAAAAHSGVRESEMRRLQTEVANSMEQISDISLSSVSQMDRNVALLSIRSLKDVMVDHLLIKRRMPKRWFVPQKEHFPAISSDFLHEIAVTRTWVEVKGFMDLELIFKMCIKDMPDGVSAIANSAKVVGLYAIRLKDTQVLANVIQFFNTFLRHAVNDRNPKALYNLFYQYRLLAQEVLKVDQPLAERICFYFKYYGQTAQQYQIPLILITAAFDLSNLLQRAYEMNVPNLQTLLNTFLELDDNPATQANEFDLRSVRKAQLLFASFLLSKGDATIVPRIFQDLKAEPKQRMIAIRKEMLAVKDRKFWEVTDRGVDFFYLDENQKKHLEVFFTRYMEPHWVEQERLASPAGVPPAGKPA
jgi:hypothetical protein